MSLTYDPLPYTNLMLTVFDLLRCGIFSYGLGEGKPLVFEVRAPVHMNDFESKTEKRN